MNTHPDRTDQNDHFESGPHSETFFGDLSQTEIGLFDSLKITSSYPKGAVVFMEGQTSKGIYIVSQGRIKLSTCSKNGKMIIMGIAEEGDVLALSETISHSLHIATADALVPSQVTFVASKDFLRFIEQNPGACLKAVKQLSRIYNTACLRIRSLGWSASVADKLAELFLEWCKTGVTKDDGIHLNFLHTQEQLAQMIGTSRETVTRALKDFRSRRLVTGKGAGLIIPDMERLEAAIGNPTLPEG